LLHCFDLNCCQAGYDLFTKKLILTAPFITFLLSKEIRICNLVNAPHTFTRIQRKNKELQFTTANKSAYLYLCTLPYRREADAILKDQDEFTDGNLPETLSPANLSAILNANGSFSAVRYTLQEHQIPTNPDLKKEFLDNFQLYPTTNPYTPFIALPKNAPFLPYFTLISWSSFISDYYSNIELSQSASEFI
jgi:hypothetical protein